MTEKLEKKNGPSPSVMSHNESYATLGPALLGFSIGPHQTCINTHSECAWSRFIVVDFDKLGMKGEAPPLEESLEALFSLATPPPSVRMEVTKR